MSKAMKIWSVILRIPIWILVIASFGASFYTAYTKMSSWAVPVIYSACLILYVIGLFLKDKNKVDSESKVNLNDFKEIEEGYQKQLQKLKKTEVEDEGDSNKD